MYAKNAIARRRLSGWAERRRYFRHLFEQVRAKVLKDADVQKVATVSEKD